MKSTVSLLLFIFSVAAFAQPDYSVSLDDSQIGVNSTVRLTYTIQNNTGVAVENISFIHNLPANLVLSDTANVETSCGENTVTAVDGGSSISFSSPGIGANSTCTISVNLTSSVAGVYPILPGDLITDSGNITPIQVDLTVDANLITVTKSFADNVLELNETTTMTLFFENNSGSLRFISLSDIFPDGMAVAGPSNAMFSASDGGNSIQFRTDAPGTTSLSLSNIILQPGSNLTYLVDVQVTQIGTLINTTSIPNGVGVGGFGVDSIEVTPQPAFSIRVTDDPVAPGELANLEVRILNTDRFNTIDGLNFTIDLNAALAGLVAETLPLNNICGTGSQITGTSMLSFTGGQLGGGQSCTFNIPIRIPGGAVPGDYTITTSTLESNSGTLQPADSTNLIVDPQPTIEMAFQQPTLEAGNTATLEITVTNTDTINDLTNFAFTIPFNELPFTPTGASMNDICGTGSLYFLSNPTTSVPLTANFTGINLLAGDFCTFTIDLEIPADITNGTYSFESSAGTGDLAGAGDAFAAPGTATLDVIAAPLLTITPIETGIEPGDIIQLEYTLTHSASAPTDATNISFTHDLDALISGMTIVGGAPASDVCGAGSMVTGTNTVTFSGGTLAPGTTCSFIVSVEVPDATAPGTFTNTSSDISATVDSTALTGPGGTVIVPVIGVLFTKTLTPDISVPGTNVTLEYTITNLSTTDALTGIVFTESLSTAITGLATDTATQNNICGAGSSLSGTSFLIFTGGDIAAGGSCTFSVNLPIPAGTAFGNYSFISSNLTATQGANSILADPSSATLELANPLSISKSFTDDPVLLGDTVNLEYTITNSSLTETITDISFTDDFDTIFSGLEAVGLPDTDICGVGSSISGTGLATFTMGELAPNSFCTFSITLQLPAGPSPGAIIPSTTSDVTGMVNSVAITSPGASDDLMLEPLQFSKTFTDSAPTGISTLTYTITNPNASQAVNINFTDDLDAVLTGLVATGLPSTDDCGMGSTVSGTSVITVSGGVLDAGQTCMIEVSVQVPAGATPGTYPSTTSTLGSTINGTNGTTGATSADLLVNPSPSFSKAFGTDPAILGDSVTLTFTIDNSGSTIDATNLDFTDNLPAGLEVAATPNANTSCTGGALTANAGDGSISYSGGTVNAGGTCTITVDITSTATGDFTNTSGDLTSDSGNSGTASDTLRVNGPPSFSKAFSPNPAVVDGVSTLTFTIDNTDSTVDATSVAFTDTFPAGLVVAGTPNVTNNAGGTFTANAGAGSVSLTGGTVTAGTSVTIIVDVTASASGDYNNTSGDLTSNLGNSGTATDSVRFNGPPSFTKVFSPDPAVVNEVSVLTFTIDNSGSTVAATSLDFTDTFPAGLVVSTTPNATNNAGGTFTAVAGAGSVSLTGGTVSAGASVTISVDVTSASAGDYNNTSGDLTSSLGNSGTAADSVRFNPLPGFSKVFAPDTIVTGDVSTLTFTIDNSGSTVDATSAAFTDTFPAGLVVAPTPNVTNNAGGTFTANAGDGSVSLSGGTITAGASVTISVDVTASTDGDYNNTSGDLTSNLGNSGGASDSLRVNPVPVFSKAFAANPGLLGDTFTLTFTIDNSGSTVAANALDFTDNLPAGMTVAATPNASTSCTGGTLTAVASSGTISYTGGTVSAGVTCTISVDVVTDSFGDFANTSGDLTSDLGNSGPATATLRVNPPPAFSKVFAPNPANVDEVVTLTFTIDNSDSTVDATAAAFTDTLPAGVVIAATPNAVNGAGGTLTAVAASDAISLTGGTITAGASITISVDVTAAAEGDYANTSGDLTSSLGNSGDASDTLRVNPAPGFSKVFSPDTIVTGGVSTLTFTIDNSGSTIDATSAAFTDTLPAGLVVADTPNVINNAGGTLTAIAGSDAISLSGGVINAGASVTISVDVTANADGDYPNTSGDLTSNLGNSGPASDTLRVNPVPIFTKAFATNPSALGDSITLTFTIDNSGSTVGANSLDFTDTLPAGMTVATTPNAANTCTGGTLTAVAGSGSISYTGGAIAAGATCTISVDIVTDNFGDFTNTSGDLTSDLGNSGTATDTLRVNPQPGFTKSFAPNPANVDEVVTLTFTIDNSNSTVDATSAEFTDNLPAGVVVAATPNVVNGAGGTVTAVAGSGSISLSGGSITAGASVTIAVDVTTSASGDYTNTSGDLTTSLGNSGTATDTLRTNPPPAFTKAFQTNPAVTGGVSTLRFTIDNTGSTSDATSVAFVDNLPAGLVVADTPNATNGAGGTLTATAGSGSITLSGGTVTAGTSVTIDVDVTAAAEGDYANTTEDLTSSLGNSGTASDSLRVNAPPSFAKSFAPNPSIVDGTSTLTFTIDNTASTADATAAAFTDTFPANMVVAATPNVVNGAGGTFTAVAGSGSVSLSGGVISAGASVTITVDVTTDIDGDFANTSGDLTSSLGNSGTASDSLRVNPVPGFSKAFGTNPVRLDQVTTLTFTIDNTSSTVDATSVDFTDNLPAGLVVAPTPNASTTCTGGTLTAVAGSSTISYTGGTASAGGTCTISVDVVADTSGDLVNTTDVLTTNLGDSGTATDTLTVAPTPGFTKVFNPSNILPESTTTLVFTIDNSGSPFDAIDLDFTDVLPAEVVVADTPNTVNNCTGGTLTAVAGSDTITYTGGTVAAGAVCTISVDVTSDLPGVYTNTSGSLTSDHGDSGTATATLNVDEGTDLTLSITGPNEAVVAGTTITYNVEVINNGPSDKVNTIVTFTFPPGVTPSASSGCGEDPSGGTTCSLGTVVAGTTANATVTADVASGFTGNIDTMATVTSDTPEIGAGDETADVSTPTTTESDISAAFSGPLVIRPGESVSFNLTITNNGPSDSLDTQIGANLPDIFELITWTCAATPGSNCSPSGEGFINDVADILDQGVLTYTITVTVPPRFLGQVTLEADVTVDGEDPGLENNQDEIVVDSTSPAELAGSLSVDRFPTVTTRDVPIEDGDFVGLRLELLNLSEFQQFDDENSNEFSITLPEGLSLEDANVITGGGTVVFDTNNRTVTWNGDVEGGQTIVIDILARLLSTDFGETITVQGEINYDSDGDGVNDTIVFTDDPTAAGDQDPTGILIVNSIPTLQTWALLIMVTSLMIGALVMRRRRLS